MNREPEENGLLDTCEELGIGFVPWGPMGMGYLTQKLDAQTKFDPKSALRSGFDRFQPQSIAANKPFVDRVTALAKRKDATTAQLSLALPVARNLELNIFFRFVHTWQHGHPEPDQAHPLSA
jgi:aryl-alcohol dehydrogenase-like predicted oxidoreductase